MEARLTFRVDEGFNDEIEDHIGYANKSEWLREAAREKLNREQSSDRGSEGEAA